MKRMSLLALITLAPLTWGAPPDKAQLDSLRPVAGMVGQWKGMASAPKALDWPTSMEVLWGFREKDGRVSINFLPTDDKLFKEGLLVVEAEKKLYRLILRDRLGEVSRFEGPRAVGESLRLHRAGEPSNEGADRVDIKLVRSGDKLIIAFARRLGKSAFETTSSVELFRDGASLTSLKDAPVCVVTGGPGRLTIDVQGRSVPLACEGAKAEFLAHPERYPAP